MGLTDLEQRLCTLIASRHAALVDDLALHVGIPTGRNNAAGLNRTRDELCHRLEKLGAVTTVIPGDVRPAWVGDSGGDIPPTAVCDRTDRTGHGRGARILISGHLDTVHDPAGPFQKLTHSADGKTAIGPGCVDMKGGLVIALAALEALEECGVPSRWSFIMNSDEETGSYHSDSALRATGAKHDCGIALEPALPDGSLVTERPGSGQFYIEATGKAAHVGRDFKSGVSAITAISRACVAAAGIADPERGLICNIGRISGGEAANVGPDLAKAWGNVRYFSPELEKEAAERIDALATTGPSLPRIKVERSFNRPSKPSNPQTMALAECARMAAADLNQPMKFASTGGVCDGNNLQAAGCPTIDTLGVRGGGLHTPQEWIEISSLVERCQLLAVLISRLSQAWPERKND